MVTRHAAAYGGFSAGDVVLRYYEATTNETLLLIPAADLQEAHMYKFEMTFDLGCVRVFLDEVYKGGFTPDGIGAGSLGERASIAVGTGVVNYSQLIVDWYFQQIINTLEGSDDGGPSRR